LTCGRIRKRQARWASVGEPGGTAAWLKVGTGSGHESCAVSLNSSYGAS